MENNRQPCFLSYRLEKDKNFNYFWVRCAKLICVSVHCKFCCFLGSGSWARDSWWNYGIYWFYSVQCRLLFLRFILLGASIISLLVIIMTLNTLGLGYHWGKISIRVAYGPATLLLSIGQSQLSRRLVMVTCMLRILRRWYLPCSTCFLTWVWQHT